MFRLADPLMLLLLPLVVIGAGWAAGRRLRGSARLPLPSGSLGGAGATVWTGLAGLLPWSRALVLALLVLAMARPQAGSRVETLPSEGVDIVVALDHSQSMRAEDFRPDHRLAVAKRVVAEFADGRPQDRLGLVVFAGLAATRCPLTRDHEMFRQFLDPVDFTFADDRGTAIGMGLATAVNRLRESKAKSKVVVLVTDGRNNAGQLAPEAAAEAARALGVRVYTVGVGTQGLAPYRVDGPLGSRYVQVPADLDEELLQGIAEVTDGRYFRATDSEGLREVFETIDRLEKTEIESRVRVLYTELFQWALIPALLLLLIERTLVATRLGAIP